MALKCNRWQDQPLICAGELLLFSLARDRNLLGATWHGIIPWWPLWQLGTGASQLADFGKIGIKAPPGPPGGQFVLSVGEEPLVADLSKMLLESP